jgi:hypothetical protein
MKEKTMRGQFGFSVGPDGNFGGPEELLIT